MFSYKFSNLLGTVYHKGNLIFSPDGYSVISPVGNRITIYDLKNSKSTTLPIESRYNFESLALSPNGSTLIAVDEKGEGLVISMVSYSVIYKHSFKMKVHSLSFSPDGKYLAACRGNRITIFKSPGLHLGEYNPFIIQRMFFGPMDDVTCVDWTSDSRIIAAGSKDTCVKIYGLPKLKNFGRYSLGGHADVIVGVHFEENSLDLMTISRNGRICIWKSSYGLSTLLEDVNSSSKSKPEDDDDGDDIDLNRGEERIDNEENKDDSEEEDSEEEDEKLSFSLASKHFILDKEQLKLTCTSYHKQTHLLVVGRNDGSFFLYELPQLTLIYSLSIGNQIVNTISLNNTGEWIGIGCETRGQLLVWEWQSESYILKQQGHSSAMSTLCYSRDGLYIATGGEDGKVKLWNTETGFCFVTFNEHSSCISSIKFAKNHKFLVSASLDGTVRTFDMVRYRNFRTLTSTRPVQFSSLAIDSSDDFVAAGGQDVFEIFLWSIKIGRLLSILSGHEGPVVSLDFHPSLASTELVSVSWDGTLRVWNAVEEDTQYESIKVNSDCLFVAYRPDGNEVAVASLDGQISMFEPKTGKQTGFIEGKKDLCVGRSDTDLITAKRKLETRSFTCFCYSADGNYILAAGQSKYICIYNRKEEMIVRKIEVTQNRSFDAVDDFINRRKMTEFGNKDLVEMRENMNNISLPGAKKGDMASRTFKPEIRIFSIQFSPTGQSFATSSTEGLLIYSLNNDNIFDPFMFDESITPENIIKAKNEENYSEALMMSLKLNERNLIEEVIESVPVCGIKLCAHSLPDIYKHKLLTFVASIIENSKHFHFYVLWIRFLITEAKFVPTPVAISIQKCLTKKYNDVSKICNYDKFSSKVLMSIADSKSKDVIKSEEGMEVEEEVESDLESDLEAMVVDY